MSNVRFIRANQNKARKVSPTSTYPKLINGNGAYSGAPALVEDASFPMSNLLDKDRASKVYVSGPNPYNSAGSDLIIEFDIAGSAQSIVAAGMLGFGLVGGSLFPSQLIVEYLPGTTYQTTGWIADIPILSIGGVRDVGSVFTARSARFWRFRFPFASGAQDGFTVAGFFLATTVTDLGFLYSRASERIVTPKTTIEGYGRTPTITRTGIPFRRWTLAYDNIDATTKATFDTLNSEASPFIFLAPDDRVYECVTDGEEFERAHVWSPPDRFQFAFPMRSLP